MANDAGGLIILSGTGCTSTEWRFLSIRVKNPLQTYTKTDILVLL